NSGSTNAVCADGYELSGHNATTCGAGGTNAFLSAGDAAVNPNPCAAGKAAQPVPPISTSLPPEPNTDPAAIATLRNNAGGPLGAACNPAGVYPNITAGGTVVGTGLAPPPAAAEANQPGEGRSEIWYYPNNPGGISSVTFTMNPATINGNAQLSEWLGVATASPLDQWGASMVAVPATTTAIATGGAMSQTGEL